MFGGFNSYSSAAEYSARAKKEQARNEPAAPAPAPAAAPAPAPAHDDHVHGPDGNHDNAHENGQGQRQGNGQHTSPSGAPIPPPVMSRDELVDFFRDCSVKLRNDEYVESLLNLYTEKDGDAVSRQMLETQKAEIERRGFEYDAATEAMRYVPHHFPGDHEVTTEMHEFMRTCRDVFQRVLKEAPVEMDREAVLEFLTEVKTKVLADETREEMLTLSESGEKMHVALHRMQMRELEARGVSERGGKDAVTRIPVMYAEDAEVKAALEGFEAASHRAIVLAMRARQLDRSALQTRGEIADGTILEWFQACNWLMVQEEIKAELKALFESTGKPPADRICDLQREMFEYAVDIDKDFGCEALKNLDVRFRAQPDKMRAFQDFLHRQNRACQIAMGKEEEILRAEAEERERAQRQMRLQQLQQKALMEEHGHLMDKIDELKPGAMARAQAMSVEERRAFAGAALREFAEVLKVKNSLDPAEKMQKLGELSDAKLEEFILLQTLMGPAAKALMAQQAQHAAAHGHGHGAHGHR